MHPVNRKIIECLDDESLSFTELLNRVGDDGNHGKFGYHLRALREFVKLEPKTKKYCLTDRGKLMAEAVRCFYHVPSREDASARYAENLKIRDHAFALYDNEDFRRKIALSFLKAGLSRGEAAVYVVSEDKLDSEIREIQKYGIDPDSLPKEAFTIIPAYEWYIKKGRAEGKTIITNWQMLSQEKKKTGFAGVHVATDAMVFFNNGKSEELLRYEESLGKQFALDLGACAICFYDKNLLEERHFLRVFKSHGHLITKDMIGKTPAWKEGVP